MNQVAAIQMCSTPDVDENLKAAEKLIAHAAERGAQLIVLPEMFAIIGSRADDKVCVKETSGSGKIQNFLAKQAQKHQLWLVGGTIPLAADNASKVRAASLVYNANGAVVARYDKMHLFDVTLSELEYYRESDSTEPGNEVVVVDTPVGKLGLSVCFDIRFPQLYRQLVQAGAEILVIPSAFTQKTGAAHWGLLARARAVDTFCYVIGACQGGTHVGGRQTYGHSLIVHPWGSVLSQLDGIDEGVATAEIDLAELHAIRRSIPLI